MSPPLIKICGLRTPEAIFAAAEAGATHIGLVHYSPSPRHIALEDAAALRKIVPSSLKTVLLLVSMEAREAAEAIAVVKPDVVQFHGAESPEGCAMMRQILPVEVWKAVGVKNVAAMAEAQDYVGTVDRILYDAPAGRLPGGQGLALDWTLLAGYPHRAPWGLAGGLSPENVAEAIRVTGAPLVDASSGLESAPGVKDLAKIAAFCRAALAAA
ncbi:MAG: phosphoribosylanthranilate isomerase [Alteraurantiacibacter sp.]